MHADYERCASCEAEYDRLERALKAQRERELRRWHGMAGACMVAALALGMALYSGVNATGALWSVATGLSFFVFGAFSFAAVSLVKAAKDTSNLQRRQFLDERL